MNYNEQIVGILLKCLNETALTGPEETQLNNWIEKSEHNRKLYEEVLDSETFKSEMKRSMGDYSSKALWKTIRGRLPQKETKLAAFLPLRTVRYAAVIMVVVISTIVYFILTKSGSQQPVIARPVPIKDILPVEKTSLTLGDGSTILLDDVKNGKIAEQGSSVIVKENGQLSYLPGNAGTNDEIVYNTLSIPKATCFSSLILSDGSKIWLNALSSIRFPAAFSLNERVVDVTGEAYFEVAKDAAKPFRVRVEGLIVEALGTHFNINAYKDEKGVKATLLNGAVKVTSGIKTGFLKPGEQAVVQPGTDEIKVVQDTDIEEIVAWKNGTFLFKRETMATIMRQVGRWYEIDVIFENDVPGEFIATLPRNVPVSRLLKILEATGEVKFEFKEGNKQIIVRR